jgi:hypothetical protein
MAATTILKSRGDWAQMQGQKAQPPRFREVLYGFDCVRVHFAPLDTYQLCPPHIREEHPGGDFQKMGTIKVSHRSLTVSPCSKRFLLILVYDQPPRGSSIANPSSDITIFHRKSS